MNLKVIGTALLVDVGIPALAATATIIGANKLKDSVLKKADNSISPAASYGVDAGLVVLGTAIKTMSDNEYLQGIGVGIGIGGGVMLVHDVAKVMIKDETKQIKFGLGTADEGGQRALPTFRPTNTASSWDDEEMDDEEMAGMGNPYTDLDYTLGNASEGDSDMQYII